MSPKEQSSYFLYGQGHSLEELHIGDLVVKDYVNPTRALRCPYRMLSSDESRMYLSVEPIRGRFTSRFAQNTSLSLSIGHLVNFDVSWSSENEKIVQAPTGERHELKDPNSFLRDQVLVEASQALQSARIWLTAARSKYLPKRVAFRKPRIWMCTGIYVLKDANMLIPNTPNPGIGAGISPEIVGIASGGASIGGSVNLGLDKGTKVEAQLLGPRVWAAQWRLLDTSYVSTRHQEVVGSEDPLRSVALYPDVMSVGTLRAGSSTGDEDAFAVTTGDLAADTNDQPEAQGEETTAAVRSTEDSQASYWDVYANVVRKFEARIV